MIPSVPAWISASSGWGSALDQLAAERVPSGKLLPASAPQLPHFLWLKWGAHRAPGSVSKDEHTAVLAWCPQSEGAETVGVALGSPSSHSVTACLLATASILVLFLREPRKSSYFSMWSLSHSLAAALRQNAALFGHRLSPPSRRDLMTSVQQ